ncbi:uncharacterized protein [Dendropsophus ebraccatus]|uniref:uncharacterized protein isoform X2 n=1 Tax=Dendropsophus ebraccatus TaxID=150705 RepID=UPI00383145E8
MYHNRCKGKLEQLSIATDQISDPTSSSCQSYWRSKRLENPATTKEGRTECQVTSSTDALPSICSSFSSESSDCCTIRCGLALLWTQGLHLNTIISGYHY